MKTISPAQTIESVYYSREFECIDQKGSGFGFRCDEQGNIKEAELTDTSRKSLQHCLDNVGTLFIDRGVVEYCNTYRQPRIVVCCRTEFSLGGFTNTCPDCGTDYNWAGQQLAPRHQWGEETGEHWADIANADYSNALDDGADNY